jgi:hypothetical protein
MRLWSLHPCYLDTKGLVACWREGLLARKFLSGETNGQLDYEVSHLKAKLDLRDVQRYDQVAMIVAPLPNPIFKVLEGRIEAGERVGETKGKMDQGASITC